MNDHYMFNYVYFKLHIDKVAKEKRNAMERYVFEKVYMVLYMYTDLWYMLIHA